MIALTGARLLIGWVSLSRWRDRLGLAGEFREDQALEARRLAAHVTRACTRVPFKAKCLPQALALGWMLRRRGIPHALVVAARPASARSGDDDLHAWIETGALIILGELPGPWAQILRAP